MKKPLTLSITNCIAMLQVHCQHSIQSLQCPLGSPEHWLLVRSCSLLGLLSWAGLRWKDGVIVPCLVPDNK